jgi:hypothetical protein
MSISALAIGAEAVRARASMRAKAAFFIMDICVFLMYSVQ